MRELTAEEQEILKDGQAAESFLSSPAMASAINELSESIANNILSTKLEETDKRERLYRLHTTLRELVAIMNHRVSLKQNLESTIADDAQEKE